MLDEIRESAQYIIGSLNENGFLSGTLSDMVLSDFPFKIFKTLSMLQTFDPVGIAAIDLQDSLLKQMSFGMEDTVLSDRTGSLPTACPQTGA